MLPRVSMLPARCAPPERVSAQTARPSARWEVRPHQMSTSVAKMRKKRTSRKPIMVAASMPLRKASRSTPESCVLPT